MTPNKFKEELLAKKSYFKKSDRWLAGNFNLSIDQVAKVKAELKEIEREYRQSTATGSKSREQILTYLDKIKANNPDVKIPPRVKEINRTRKIASYKGGDPDNVLIIGDLHEPWTLDGYLEFNIGLQKKYNVGTIIFIGDIVDGHSWSFHTHDVDGMSVKDELTLAIERLKPWYEAFPEAIVTLGNHDLLISRKAREYGLSQLFIRHLGDILGAPPTWKFVQNFYKDKVYYTHGSMGDAIRRAKDMRHSVVQGHLHSQSFVQWSVSEIDAIFGLQVGCGIDRKAYAFEYAKEMTKKPIIGSGLVLERGKLPLIELMQL